MSTGEGNPLAHHGRLAYLEIAALDARRSATFYEQLLGWRIDVRSDGDLRFSSADGLYIGRWVTGRAVPREPGLVVYVYVDGLDAALARALAHGGELERAPVLEGDVRVARVRDPAGNLIGLWQFAG